MPIRAWSMGGKLFDICSFLSTLRHAQVLVHSITALVGCDYAKKFKTDTRTPGLHDYFFLVYFVFIILFAEMLSTLLDGNDLDFWGILGDNFYDQSGKITKFIYDQLSPEAKSKIMLTVPGNVSAWTDVARGFLGHQCVLFSDTIFLSIQHDYWILGSPDVGLPDDQHAYGHAQWYAQDTKAAEELLPGKKTNAGVPPFNFSETNGLANIENSFWYNQIGNLGLVGFSGAFSLVESKPLMEEACTWFGDQVKRGDLEAVLLVGHWDKPGMGASTDMAVPAFYEEMAALDGCQELDTQGFVLFHFLFVFASDFSFFPGSLNSLWVIPTAIFHTHTEIIILVGWWRVKEWKDVETTGLQFLTQRIRC